MTFYKYTDFRPFQKIKITARATIDAFSHTERSYNNNKKPKTVNKEINLTQFDRQKNEVQIS